MVALKMKKIWFFLALFILITVNLNIISQFILPDPIIYDLVIQNGRVLNPETNFDQTGIYIGIINGRITEITGNYVLRGKRAIDASGLIVTPGFIDLLSYDPNPVGVWNKIADGITTNIGMHGSTVDPESWYSKYDRENTPLHYGASFFYTAARNAFGLGRYQSASPAQIQVLQKLAENAIKNGCLGISISLEYIPGISAAECLALMRVGQKYNVPVAYHLRYSDMEEPGTNFDALNEVIGYARATGAAVHIDHINSTGGTFSMKESLELLNKARDEGLDITACTYPYNYWGTYLNSARFDPGWQTRFRISYQDLQLGGSSERLTEKSFAYYQKQGKLAIAYAIPENDLRVALRCPWVMMGSDGILEPGYNNHPRASGMCARLIGHYARDEKVLSLMDAIAKLTILPAKRLEPQAPSLKCKGRIMIGADADITIFDYQKIIDRATVEHPEYMSEGIMYVLINGVIVKDPQGIHKGISKGTGIKTEFIPAKYLPNSIVWRDIKIPLINYRGNDYLDLEWLAPLDYKIKAENGSKQFRITRARAGQPAGQNISPPPVPEGALMLERGFSAVYRDLSFPLISIGERLFLPVSALESMGVRLEKSGE
jgi:N-acyl-D-aspartate/D-glutamate deacylase